MQRRWGRLKIAVLSALLLAAGCSEPPPAPTLQEKWAKVQSLNVEDATVDDLIARLGAPYRDEESKTRSRFWYPFEGVTRSKTKATAPMLLVILDDAGSITSYMRTEPVLDPGAKPVDLRIVPRDYKIKINGKWKTKALETGKQAE